MESLLQFLLTLVGLAPEAFAKLRDEVDTHNVELRAWKRVKRGDRGPRPKAPPAILPWQQTLDRPVGTVLLRTFSQYCDTISHSRDVRASIAELAEQHDPRAARALFANIAASPSPSNVGASDAVVLNAISQMASMLNQQLSAMVTILSDVRTAVDAQAVETDTDDDPGADAVIVPKTALLDANGRPLRGGALTGRLRMLGFTVEAVPLAVENSTFPAPNPDDSPSENAE